jgi:hypothetical protein
MSKLYIGFNDVKDARTQGSWELLQECLSSHIRAGGVVVVEHRAEDAAPEFVVSLNSEEALKTWITK